MTKREYKRAIDDFLTQQWSFLLQCSKNILKSKKTDPNDLVAELVVFLYDNQAKLEWNVSIQMLTGFSLSWMKLQSQYKSTPFNRKYQNRNEEVSEVSMEEQFIDFQPEDLSEDEYVTDLRRVYTDEQIENILKIHDIYPTLNKTEKILFDAYFIENLSYDKIKDKYTFFRVDKNGKKKFYKCRVSIFHLMKDLKNNIRGKL